ncbi:Prophage tail fibre N-terminal [Plesiomonas shigelloides]|uniref:prophage tail fiber N-terminal domain-containing protein n=1 Tax=Plesiomonas shigelloides TaxID=703 RepID=UPI000DFC447D|nr:prophage tail fiber N-terminal domain-containing protein [Plesiomonas shigelloides]SUB63828.1 Prophage tail fibre N-terminal [Plesiomonas shigelloides]
MIRVFGQITDASGKGVAGAMIELRALKSSTEVLYGSVFTYKCDASGHYEFPLAIGAYDAYAQNDICGDMDYLGTAVVTADTYDGGLHHILVDGGINITPPMLDTAMEFALRAEKAATSAKSDRIQTGKDVIVTGQNKQVAETKAQESATSADEAKAARDSIVQDANEVRLNTQQVTDNAASVASNMALVQRNAEQVAQNTQTVSTKALQVSENTQSVAANTQAVSLMRDEVAAKTSMAQAAADTATQKAASAAEHDAAAAEYARQAQEAAQATAGALIDGGAADLSTGVYPQPVQVSGTARPTFWKVTKGGAVGGVDYGVGDTLIYTVAGSGSYYKIDNTESVTSVQGEKGAVTLTPEKIGADPSGAASAGIKQHEAKSGAHNIGGIYGLDEALNGRVSKIIQLAPGADLNAVTDTGFYRLSSSAMNAPAGFSVAYGLLQVIRGNDTITQTIAGYSDGRRASRSGSPADIGGTGKYTQWYEIYAQNSILGQVSQLAGVPTGAIIERGSNANGEYVKWADGTMVCYWRTSFSTSCTSPYGAGLYTGSVTWTFPARFISSPITPPPGIRLSTGASWSVPFSATPTEANYYVVDAASRPVGTQAEFVGFAIGRWY